MGYWRIGGNYANRNDGRTRTGEKQLAPSHLLLMVMLIAQPRLGSFMALKRKERARVQWSARRCGHDDNRPVIRSIIELVLPSTLIMSRLRNSKSPAVSTPRPPGELARKLGSLPQGDSRTLAASSIAIALSIASPLYNTCDVPSDGDAVQGRHTGWQTAYSAARMAIEITKESSDMFPPLKAVVGAMSVLIKNFDVGALPVN